MKASIVDLRYRMKDILRALKRNEKITILYHGKVAGTIIPPEKKKPNMKASEHPFFGMRKEKITQKDVDRMMDELRGGRYRDLRH